MSLKQMLKTYIQEDLGRRKGVEEIGDNDSLIEREILDSLALQNLLMFIEERTGTRIPDEEVLLENFETITAIEQTVDRIRTRGIGSRP